MKRVTVLIHFSDKHLKLISKQTGYLFILRYNYQRPIASISLVSSDSQRKAIFTDLALSTYRVGVAEVGVLHLPLDRRPVHHSE